MPAPWLLKFWHAAGRSEGKNAMANYAVDSLQDGCYPGIVVLINILGIQNQSDLDAVEGTIVPVAPRAAPYGVLLFLFCMDFMEQ